MNPSTALATVLVDELVRHGVHEVVVCPGSRSAPLAYAVQAAERAGRLRMHVRVDERSAGFLALGLAKAAHQPVAILTTSGTAVANLHPAVLEAHHAAVPLIVLSADRPPELRGTGANQTTVQPGIFGGAVRWSHELGAPERRDGQVPGWRATAARAVAAARGFTPGHAGPVHLNVPLREPLVPTDEGWPWTLAGRPGEEPWTRLARVDLAPAFETVEPGGRTLVVLGDVPDPVLSVRAVTWASRHGWPVVAEPFGAHDRSVVVPHGSLLLTATGWLERNLPERVITVGRTTLSRAVTALLRRADVRVENVSPTPEWADPTWATAKVHPWTVLTLPPSGDVQAPPEWSAAWHDAGSALAKALAAADLPWPSGLAVARGVAAALPDGALLFVGSSKTVRDLDLAAATWPEDVQVAANRGLAGIDGCLSTAVGLALGSERPTYALVGDLTFLHDSNAFLVGPDEPQPDLTAVVVNDDGGGIFTLLEPGEPDRSEDFERLFGTPTGADLAALCRAHGVAHQRITDVAGLAEAVAEPPAGLRVAEVRVDRTAHRDLHQSLRQLATKQLG